MAFMLKFVFISKHRRTERKWDLSLAASSFAPNIKDSIQVAHTIAETKEHESSAAFLECTWTRSLKQSSKGWNQYPGMWSRNPKGWLNPRCHTTWPIYPVVYCISDLKISHIHMIFQNIKLGIIIRVFFVFPYINLIKFSSLHAIFVERRVNN